jgi:cell division transport system permease protein
MLRHDLPPDRDAGFFLPAIVGFMVFLAGLALAGRMAAENLLARWQSSIESAFTVELPPVPQESHAAAEARQQAALAVIAATPGVASATLVSDAEKWRLLSPWLGTEAASLDLPLPDLVAVATVPGATIDLVALTSRLQADSPGASIDDHGRWRGAIAGIAEAADLAALALLLLIGAAAAATVVFVTRAGLSSHRRVIEILHLIGAHDGYIAGQFQRHALVPGLLGGVAGSVAAAAAFEAARRWLPGVSPDQLSLTPLQWAGFALLAPGATLLASATVRYTVLRALKRLV